MLFSSFETDAVRASANPVSDMLGHVSPVKVILPEIDMWLLGLGALQQESHGRLLTDVYGTGYHQEEICDLLHLSCFQIIFTMEKTCRFTI